ncbi:MAG: lipid-A-disaccharide synthase [Phycisphaerae bacterium]
MNYHRQADPLVLISAAEPSADMHGAALIQAVRKVRPKTRFVGNGGPAMADAACEILFDMTAHAAMLHNALGAAGHAYTMLKTATAFLRNNHVDAVVVIDSPTLHLPLAGQAHALGNAVLYYVAPQLWAWGAHRIYQLRHNVDRVAAILPFEESYFQKQGVRATFVGHPLIDSLNAAKPDDRTVKHIRGNADLFVAILPGSRKQVVEQVLPGQIEVAERIAQAVPAARFGVSIAGERVEPVVRDLLRRSPVPINAYRDHHRDLIAAADLVLVASGTASLEVALMGKPLIVMYNASPLIYHLLGRWIIKTPYLSLPNIIAQREIIPEFMPYYRSTEPIAEIAIELLRHPEQRTQVTRELSAALKPLQTKSASQNTAALLLNLMEG